MDRIEKHTYHQSLLRKTAFFILALGFFLVSCKQQETSSAKENKRAQAFHHFILKLRVLPLPLHLDAISLDKGTFKQLDEEDTLFIKEPYSLYYGLLPDTSRFYSVLMLGVGDSYVPNLFTFDRQGNKIDAIGLKIYGTPYGPGIGYSSSSGTIGTDLSIHCSDSTFVFEVDSNTIEIPGTKKLLCNFQDGQINPNGQIQAKERNTETPASK